jgi:cobalt-zinc-cadmium efflux system membrane fusion protein
MKTQHITLILAAAVLSATTTLTFAADGHGHDEKAKPQAKADDHDDHDEHAEEGGGHGDEVKLSDAMIKLHGITVGKAQQRSLAASFITPARVSFNTEAMAHIGSVVSGRVVEIKVRIGDKVKKDDVLLVVESPELGRAQSELLQRRTEVEIAEAGISPAKDSYERAKSLYDKTQGIALGEVQKREVEYRAAVGALSSSKAAAQAAENALHLLSFSQDDVKRLVETGEINPRFVIKAPISGQVVEREVTLGELVSPDKEQLLVLADTKDYWVMADVPEARLGDISIGSKAEIQVVAMPKTRIEGEVSLVSAEVDPGTRAARVRIVVTNDNDKLKPGMFARVTLHGTDGDQMLAIPEESVQFIEGSPSVFVPVDGEKNTFARRVVAVGPVTAGYVPVSSGLKDGDELVTASTFILKAELGKSEAGHSH